MSNCVNEGRVVYDKELLLKTWAARNNWQCFDGDFTWFASGHCPDNGSSSCPLTMKQDRPCPMTPEDEAEIAQSWSRYNEKHNRR